MAVGCLVFTALQGLHRVYVGLLGLVVLDGLGGVTSTSPCLQTGFLLQGHKKLKTKPSVFRICLVGAYLLGGGRVLRIKALP